MIQYTKKGNRVKKIIHKIIIENLKHKTIIGILPKERKRKQKVLISAEIVISQNSTLENKVLKNGDINKTINYGEICEKIISILDSEKYKLLEEATEDICNKLMNEYSKIEKIDITIKKPNAPIKEKTEFVGVKFEKYK